MWVHHRLVVCDSIWEAGDSAREVAKGVAKREAGSNQHCRNQAMKTATIALRSYGMVLTVYSDVHG